MIYNMVLAGVGGQGVISAADVIAHAAMKRNLNVKMIKYKGLAQRGGSVKVFIRLGEVSVAKVPLKGADLLVSFELAEFLNVEEYVGPKTKVVVAKYKWPSLLNQLGRERYPDYLEDELRTRGYILVDPLTELKENNLPLITLNSYMLGVVSSVKGFPMDSDAIKDALLSKVKRFRRENERAFELGSASLRSF